MEKTKRKNKSDYGENFVPPDGGWGWVVCFASGFTNICMFPVFNQFGLIFRDKLLNLGLTNKEITSIVNTHFAVSSLSGFLNGYIFRKFSYRGVALTASLIVISGIYCLVYSETFLIYMLVYALYLGMGKGFVISAKQVAFLTYFKKNRRRALSIIVTLPALGQVIMPYLVIFLMYHYGIKGTLLIFCGISMHTFAASLAYQPVKWHIRKGMRAILNTDEVFCVYCGLRNENELKRLNSKNSRENLFMYDADEKFCNCSEIKTLTQNGKTNLSENGLQRTEEQEIEKKRSILKRIVSFLDLGLFKDMTFMNICIGMTCTIFVEQNFTILAPFFLSDFGYSYEQITLAISITRIPDVISRILTPYVVQRIKWENRTFWLICVMAMTFAEIIIARNPSFEWIVALMFFSGIFRGAKMIFHGMLIPDYVPLKRMPAALGLNRMLGGLLTLSLGPIIGLIRDNSNFQMALIFLNFMAMIPITTWLIEIYYKRMVERQESENIIVNNNNEGAKDEQNPMLTVKSSS